MLKALVQHIIEGNIYYGLEVYELNGTEHFSLLQLKKQKGELEVIIEKSSDKLIDLLPLIDKNAQFHLTINTTKVLKKEVGAESKYNNELLVVNAFPNLKLDNFYYEILVSENNTIVCISKKEYIDWYLEQIEKLGLKPFSVSIGITQLNNLSTVFKGHLLGTNYNVSFEENSFTTYHPFLEFDIRSYNINGIALKNFNLLSFSKILGYLQNTVQISNLIDLNINFKRGFKNRRFFNFGLKTMLVFFLALLLGNFLLFNNYNTKNQALEASLASVLVQDNSLQKLKERVLLKEERLKLLTNSKNSKVTFYFDELGKSLPNSIYLSQMQYQPLLSPLRVNKLIEIKSNNLQISGITNDKIAFTEWSDNLELKKWVDKVEIIDYQYISKSSADFTINILINETE